MATGKTKTSNAEIKEKVDEAMTSVKENKIGEASRMIGAASEVVLASNMSSEEISALKPRVKEVVAELVVVGWNNAAKVAWLRFNLPSKEARSLKSMVAREFSDILNTGWMNPIPKATYAFGLARDEMVAELVRRKLDETPASDAVSLLFKLSIRK